MGKKITVMFFVAACVMFVIVGAKFVRDTGLLRKYPEAEYFDEADSHKRPVYELLSDREKAVYHAMYEGMKGHKEKIELPYEISGDTYSKLYCIVEKQESELFYADSTYYTAEKLRDANIIYRLSDAECETKIQALENAKIAAVASIRRSDDEYSKALKIHDHIVKNCKYITGEDQMFSSTAYGCLVEGKANCEGYAKAFDLLARECGLRSILVTGVTDTGENHAWNQLEVNGKWYNLDVTWDDTDIAGDVRRAYFLCSDDDFGSTHTADKENFDPFECSGGDDEYYIRSGKYADSLESAENIIRTGIFENSKNIEIKFSDENLYNKFKARYLEQRHIFNVIAAEDPALASNISISVRENEKECCITLVFNDD